MPSRLTHRPSGLFDFCRAGWLNGVTLRAVSPLNTEQGSGRLGSLRGYLSLSTWFRISSTSWKARDSGERNTSTARRSLCQGDTEVFTNICWI